MAKGAPDWLQSVQDPEGRYGAKVDAGGFLAVGSINGVGFIGSEGIILTTSASLASGEAGTATWNNVEPPKLGKYNWLHVSSNDNSALIWVELRNLTTDGVIISEYITGAFSWNLDGFTVYGTDTMRLRIINLADRDITIRAQVMWVEIPE